MGGQYRHSSDDDGAFNVGNGDGESANEDHGDETFEASFNWEADSNVEFQDIAGYEHVKRELFNSVIDPDVNNPDSYERFQIDPVRGILFHGPPGTGKTMFGRALADILDRPFVELSQADLTSKWINESPQLVQSLFEQAEEFNGVVFVDEAEQLLGKRTGGGNAHNEDMKLTNTFLSQLSREDQDFILILTTNRRDMIDPAILRPGRIDLEIEVGLPPFEARKEIIEDTLIGVPQKVSETTTADIAQLTDGWNCAEVERCVKRARQIAASEDAKYLTDEHIQTGYEEYNKRVDRKQSER